MGLVRCWRTGSGADEWGERRVGSCGRERESSKHGIELKVEDMVEEARCEREGVGI